MEQNHVILSLEDYNNLRDFKKEMIENPDATFAFTPFNHSESYNPKTYYVTKDIEMKRILKRNEFLTQMWDEFINQKDKEPKNQELLASTVKSWRFIKVLKWYFKKGEE